MVMDFMVGGVDTYVAQDEGARVRRRFRLRSTAESKGEALE
jgi:hypothetical protein